MNKVSAISNALRALQNTDKDQALTTKQNQMIKKSLSVLSKNSQIGIIQAAIKDGKIHQFDVDDLNKEFVSIKSSLCSQDEKLLEIMGNFHSLHQRQRPDQKLQTSDIGSIGSFSVQKKVISKSKEE